MKPFIINLHSLYFKLVLVLVFMYPQIPARYQYSTILVASNNVTGAMRKFGEVLRTFYSKKADYRRADYSINYLG